MKCSMELMFKCLMDLMENTLRMREIINAKHSE